MLKKMGKAAAAGFVSGAAEACVEEAGQYAWKKFKNTRPGKSVTKFFK